MFKHYCNLTLLSIAMTGVKCKNDLEVVTCLNNPCDTAQCPNLPDALCVSSNFVNVQLISLIVLVTISLAAVV